MFELGKIPVASAVEIGNNDALIGSSQPTVNVAGQIYSAVPQENFAPVSQSYGPTPAPGCSNGIQGYSIGQPYPYSSPNTIVHSYSGTQTVWNPVHVSDAPVTPLYASHSGNIGDASGISGQAIPMPISQGDSSGATSQQSESAVARLLSIPCVFWVYIVSLVLIISGSVLISIAKTSIHFEKYTTSCTDDSLYYDDDYSNGVRYTHHHPNSHDCVQSKCIGNGCGQYGTGVALVVVGCFICAVSLCCHVGSCCRQRQNVYGNPNVLVVAGQPYPVGYNDYDYYHRRFYFGSFWNPWWFRGRSGHNINHNVHHNHGRQIHNAMHHHQHHQIHMHGHNLHHNVHHNHGVHHHH